MPKVFRYSEFHQRALDEGRALPINKWMKEPKVPRRKPQSKDLYQAASEHADRIEAEMRRIGLWSEHPPGPEAFQFRRAFAGDTMAYNQWLQFVLIPRVRQIIANKEKFPGSSSTAAQAVREFDGRDDCDALISALAEFDRLFGARR
ncbi:MAG: YqcC family protein [Phycisphaerales bacterium]|nr:YqcC family protein [Phycisphaerales bacterium]MCB9862304.1 YqcC family protein [Phycisphaerales bacterium]